MDGVGGGGVKQSAEATAARAGDHPVVEGGARLGYGASGVLHLLLAYVTAKIALQGGGGQASQSGALSQLVGEPAGRALVWLLFVGFVLLAVWQLTEVVVRRKAFERAKAAGKLVLYGALGWTSFTFASGGRSSSNEQTQDFTVTLMQAPAGRVLVGLVGVGILGVAGYHVHKGWAARFRKDLREHPGAAATVAGRVGYVAKGVALAAVGVLFLTAAVQQRADKSTGLDGGLRSLRDLPAGTVVLLAIAVGLAAYGLYSFARARYARV